MPATAPPLKRRTARTSTSHATGHLAPSERAYRELRRRILDNELTPGSRYAIDELATLLGLGPVPVRSALTRLADEDLIDGLARAAARVRPLYVEEIGEILEITLALEPMAARDVAMQDLRKSDLDRLSAAVDQMDAALLKGDMLAWARADTLFHTRLRGLCANKRLAALLEKLADARHRARMQTLGLRPVPVQSNRDHAAVVEAVRRHDAESAYALHRAHLARSSQMLVALLRGRGGSPSARI